MLLLLNCIPAHVNANKTFDAQVVSTWVKHDRYSCSVELTRNLSVANHPHRTIHSILVENAMFTYNLANVPVLCASDLHDTN